MGLFTRTFNHKNWVDSVDRVTAGGDNGFNVRFQALQVDLDAIAAALNAVASGVPKERTINLAPQLTQSGNDGWDHKLGYAQKRSGAGGASGLMTAPLPNTGQIRKFRVIGSNTGQGTLQMELFRQNLDGSSRDAVAQIFGVHTEPGGVFDLSAGPAAGTEVLDPAFTYFISARLSSAAGTDIVQINGFQIVCVTG
ncbi:hypothetical protein [Nocardia transvalensis]|uniref:hypothetical protein n=1 Tax=Nocardia transvalensis TaxID=37333 RepID=UPI0018941235|nr:hypothetical protein [Nocardia transvalensis]MBF6328317.1 hypothetical protein [Nocardia transvalensis]